MNEQNIKDIDMKEHDINDPDRFRQIGFALSIIYFFNNFLQAFAQFLDLSDVLKVIVFGFFGISAVLLGLFKFHKGLSFGLVVGGVLLTRAAWLSYHFKLTELLQFLIALFLLVLLSFALYRLARK